MQSCIKDDPPKRREGRAIFNEVVLVAMKKKGASEIHVMSICGIWLSSIYEYGLTIGVCFLTKRRGEASQLELCAKKLLTYKKIMLKFFIVLVIPVTVVYAQYTTGGRDR